LFAKLGISVVGLSHLSTTRALDQLSDFLVRKLLEVLLPVADGQELERPLGAGVKIRSSDDLSLCGLRYRFEHDPVP
jgi:hypothetical protein